MPPASSRSAASTTATVGHAKATASKKSAQVSKSAKRKSIATDPALLQGSSDEDGEGPDDHEDEQQQASSKLAKHGSSSQKATSALSRTTKAQTSAVSSALNASPRRSTRLSGEGIGSQQQQQSSIEAARGASSQASRSSKAASSSQGQSTVPNKRKAPSSGRSGNTVNSTHPTPPETDSETAEGRLEQSTQRKGSTQSQSQTSKAKKPKVASGEGQQERRVCLQTLHTDQSGISTCDVLCADASFLIHHRELHLPHLQMAPMSLITSLSHGWDKPVKAPRLQARNKRLQRQHHNRCPHVRKWHLAAQHQQVRVNP